MLQSQPLQSAKTVLLEDAASVYRNDWTAELKLLKEREALLCFVQRRPGLCMGLCLTKIVPCCYFSCTWELKAECCICGSAHHCWLHNQAEFAFSTYEFRWFSSIPENIFFSFLVQNLLTSSILKMPVSEEDGSFHKTFAVPRNRPLASPLQVTKHTLLHMYVDSTALARACQLSWVGRMDLGSPAVPVQVQPALLASCSPTLCCHDTGSGSVPKCLLC